MSPDGERDARSRWNARHAERGAPGDPARFLTDRAEKLPTAGSALDVAGGTGRHALWLARRGLEVTLLDVSDVALARAAQAAAADGVTITTVQVDLAPSTLPPGPFDVVLVHHFLDREVWRSLPSRLSPGGVLLACQPTVRNLERHPRPSRRWLLDEGEIHRLADLACADEELRALEVAEGWTAEDRHEGWLVLQRRP